MREEEKQTFTFTYSAPTEAERTEIEQIRRQYLPAGQAAEKLERLRSLHARVMRAPKIAAALLGTAAVLIFGLGLTMVLEWRIYVWGSLVAAAGVAVAAVVYPVRKAILNRSKARYGGEILALGKELLNE